MIKETFFVNGKYERQSYFWRRTSLSTGRVLRIMQSGKMCRLNW
ncbi:hypothetical protein KKC1_34650 [Calderihabitans maritimus]|uniref:Uncharacterized protein n=1 Tax=Calderihabitans maritimus TaxID=1246530 RepID=A0A1Z5HXV5_9FIRM|nr:hypothetical protein KKC1_34650 [Calderihabitans maritimus]